MKFFSKEPTYPPDGALKTESWFAWYPVNIGRETRWLEFVTVEFKYWEGYGSFAEPEWFMERFIN
jgi:hypothetical protein